MTTSQPTPSPLTDLKKRVNEARGLIQDLLTELVGPVSLDYDFYREWNGCWKVRVEVTGAANGRLDFTLLETAEGAMLALPRPMPERWRTQTGIPAGDGTRWTLDEPVIWCTSPRPEASASRAGKRAQRVRPADAWRVVEVAGNP